MTTSAFRVALLTALSACGASTLAPAAHAQPPGTTCHTATGIPQLDHVVVAVRDLDATRDALQDAGFVVKRGRDHADGLRNAHVKFRDRTSLEFMTLTGPPSSAIARSYAERLARGDRGAFVALSVPRLDAVERAARDPGLETVRTRSGAWSFVSFTSTSDAAALFFVAGGTPSVDPDSLLAHASGAAGVQTAWLEGGPRLDRLLHTLGATPCDTMRVPDGRVGTRWTLGTGMLAVVRGRAQDAPPCVLGVELRSPAIARAADGATTSSTARTPVTRELIPGFWVRAGTSPGASH